MSSAGTLLITHDDELAEEIARLAAVADRELRRVVDPHTEAEGWRSASLVLLDAAAARAAATAGQARRPGVVLVCTKPPPGFWRCAFEIGAQHAITLPDDEARLVDLLAGDGDAEQRPGRVLAVVGGSGGAGASVLATATALAAASRGDRTLLLDCDPLGGGLDLAVGAEETPGLRWSGLAVSGGRVAVHALHDALPAHRIGSGAVTLLACDRDGESSGLTPHALRGVIDAGRRTGSTVVCDLPRTITETGAAGIAHADITVLVVPAEVRACAAAARVVQSLRDVAGRARVVVRGPARSGLTAADIGRVVGLDVLATMRPQPGIAAALDRGGLGSAGAGTRGPLGRTAQRVLAALDHADTAPVVPAGAS